MTASVNIDMVGTLLTLGDWDKQADGRITGPYGVEITAPRSGDLMISFPDPHSGCTAHVTLSGQWSYGTAVDLATHLGMMARLVATVRNTEGD